jgi:hypothetical protein
MQRRKSAALGQYRSLVLHHGVDCNRRPFLSSRAARLKHAVPSITQVDRHVMPPIAAPVGA